MSHDGESGEQIPDLPSPFVGSRARVGVSLTGCQVALVDANIYAEPTRERDVAMNLLAFIGADTAFEVDVVHLVRIEP